MLTRKSASGCTVAVRGHCISVAEVKQWTSGTLCASSHRFDSLLKLRQTMIERSTSYRREFVRGARRTSGKFPGATHIVGVFEPAGMHAEIAIGKLQKSS